MGMRRNGFTLIELLITLTVMVILMGLAVVMLRSTQVNARDNERASDVSTIARGLENRYDRNSLSRGDISSEVITAPGYPSVDEIRWAMDNDIPGHAKQGNFLTDDLPGTSATSFVAPNNGKFTVICTSSCGAAENNTTINSAFSGVDADQVAKSNYYIYEPIMANGNICMSLSSECIRYNLYYIKEADGSRQTIRSKHQ